MGILREYMVAAKLVVTAAMKLCTLLGVKPVCYRC